MKYKMVIAIGIILAFICLMVATPKTVVADERNGHWDMDGHCDEGYSPDPPALVSITHENLNVNVNIVDDDDVLLEVNIGLSVGCTDSNYAFTEFDWDIKFYCENSESNVIYNPTGKLSVTLTGFDSASRDFLYQSLSEEDTIKIVVDATITAYDTTVPTAMPMTGSPLNRNVTATITMT